MGIMREMHCMTATEHTLEDAIAIAALNVNEHAGESIEKTEPEAKSPHHHL